MPLLQTVSQLDASTLQRELGRLVEAELVHQRGLPPQATYTFKHALIQDAAYESLLKSTRQHYHQRIAQVLKPSFLRQLKDNLNFWHITILRQVSQSRQFTIGITLVNELSSAQPMWKRLAHLRQGLALLQTFPETPERLQREVDMLIALGASLRCHERLCSS